MKETSAEAALAMERVEAALADLELAYAEFCEWMRQYDERNGIPHRVQKTSEAAE